MNIAPLIRADQKRNMLQNVESLVLEGIESGNVGEMTDEEWTLLIFGQLIC